MDRALLETALTRRAVIFDFDGVLAKIMVDWASLKKELRELIAGEIGACDELTPFDLRLNTLLHQAPRELIVRVDQLIEAYELKPFDQHLIFPEMIAAVKELSSNGVMLFICSSNTRKVIHKILMVSGISACFRQIVSREDVQQRKPSPEGLLKIITENQLNKGDVLFIGDRDIDRQAGDLAEIQTILVHPTSPVCLSNTGLKTPFA